MAMAARYSRPHRSSSIEPGPIAASVCPRPIRPHRPELDRMTARRVQTQAMGPHRRRQRRPTAKSPNSLQWFFDRLKKILSLSDITQLVFESNKLLIEFQGDRMMRGGNLEVMLRLCVPQLNKEVETMNRLIQSTAKNAKMLLALQKDLAVGYPSSTANGLPGGDQLSDAQQELAQIRSARAAFPHAAGRCCQRSSAHREAQS